MAMLLQEVVCWAWHVLTASWLMDPRLVWWKQRLVFHNLAAVVGNGVAEKALLSSKRYTAQEALDVGLVDKVVPKDEVLAATKSQMEELTAFSARTLEITKKVMRRDAVETLENKREEDIKEFVDCVTDEEVQRAIGMQIERITKKK
ncbi:enoyl-CoA delta isomerase 1, mitochondrial-like isoform X2 [Acropora muricata]|uniref:enoyl-CoA delta isomerase 1, mitochondrial-like isoform X2 n=1 Tax=Acropora muricata TaxID=159855 RepID=UPI0034E5B2BF